MSITRKALVRRLLVPIAAVAMALGSATAALAGPDAGPTYNDSSASHRESVRQAAGDGATRAEPERCFWGDWAYGQIEGPTAGDPPHRYPLRVFGTTVRFWSGVTNACSWAAAEFLREGDILSVDVGRFTVGDDELRSRGHGDGCPQVVSDCSFWMPHDEVVRRSGGGYDVSRTRAPMWGGQTVTPNIVGALRPVRICVTRGTETLCGSWYVDGDRYGD